MSEINQRQLYKLLKNFNKPELIAIIALLYLSACKVREVLALKIEDVDVVERDGVEILVVRFKNRLCQIPLKQKTYERFFGLLFLKHYLKCNGDNVFKYSDAYLRTFMRRQLHSNPTEFKQLRMQHLSEKFSLSFVEINLFCGFNIFC